MIRSTFRYNIKLIRVTKDFEIYNTYLYTERNTRIKIIRTLAKITM